MLNVGNLISTPPRNSNKRLFHRALAVSALAFACVQLLDARSTTTDEFNRANSSTLGANWTATSSGMSISGNKAVPAGASGIDHKFAYYSGASWNATHSSQAVFYGAMGADMTLTVRHQSNGDLYMLDVNSGSQHTRIYKYVDGTFTQLRDFNVSPTSGHTYKFEVSGTTLRAYDDGVQIGTDLTDTTLSGGAPGIGGRAYAPGEWDDWVGGGAGGTSGSLPRLSINDIVGGAAVGARVPLTSSNGQYWDRGTPSAITFDATSGTIYASNADSYVAQISLPTMVNSSNKAELPYVSFVQGQGFTDPIEGQRHEADNNGSEAASLWGILATPDRLYGTHSIGYDANNTQVKSHWSRPKNLATTGDVKGLDRFWDGAGSGLDFAQYSGFTSGYLFRVPGEWQSAFDGRTMGSGQCCQSIIFRNSYGPAAGVFDPALIGSGNPEPHSWKPLVYYPNTHQTLGCWEEPNPDYPATSNQPTRGCQHPYFGYTTTIRGAVMINNTRTMAFFGTQGTGTPCYGNGTSNPDLHGDQVPDEPQGVIYCYDPSSTAKANHQYPYRYFIWLYDIEDLVDAYNDVVNPYDVLPYEGEEFFFPVAAPTTGGEALVRISGADYDPATRSLYLVQSNIDKFEPCCAVTALLWKFPVNIPQQ
jgi:hypothetical protein